MTSRQSIPDELASMLDRLADTIVSSLGFDVVVISLVRPDGMLEVASAAGHESVRSGLLGTVATAEAWEESSREPTRKPGCDSCASTAPTRVP